MWQNIANNCVYHTFVMLLGHMMEHEKSTSVQLECVNLIFATSMPSAASAVHAPFVSSDADNTHQLPTQTNFLYSP